MSRRRMFTDRRPLPLARGCHPRLAAPLFALALTLVAAPRLVRAHEGVPPAPHDLGAAWTLDPPVLIALLLGAGFYAAGAARLGRRDRGGRLLPRSRRIAYWIGLAAGAFALISPIAALGSALFAAHMAQHLFLILIAPPLILMGRPAIVWLWAFDRDRRRTIGRWWRSDRVAGLIRRPAGNALIAFGLHAAAIWIWHLPALYQAALGDEAIHALEHLTFGATAIAFWWAVLPALGRPRLGQGTGVLLLFAAAMQSTVLGVLMTFSAMPWYPAYAPTATAWGLSPIADQQLAGLIMWIPAGAIYTAIAVALVLAWLGEEERRSVGRTLTPTLSQRERE